MISDLRRLVTTPPISTVSRKHVTEATTKAPTEAIDNWIMILILCIVIPVIIILGLVLYKLYLHHTKGKQRQQGKHGKLV